MFWIFAAVVLILAVVHPGFRKVVFWVGGTAAIVFMIVAFNEIAPRQQPVVAQQSQQDIPFDPDAYLAEVCKDTPNPTTRFVACSKP